MRSNRNRRIVSLLTAFCLIVMLMPYGSGSTFSVNAAERFTVSGIYNLSNLDCYYIGQTAANFTADDVNISTLSDSENFMCTLTLPDLRYLDEKVRGVFPYLVPNEEDKDLLVDNFLSGKAYSLSTNGSITKCYVDYRNSNEVYLELPKLNVFYSNPEFYIPSGIYEVAVLVITGDSDYILSGDSSIDCSGLKGDLYYAGKQVIFSSEKDGGYTGPELTDSSIVYVDAAVYADGEILPANRLTILGYDESGKLLGMPPFHAEAGTNVYFTVDLDDSLAEYRYAYSIPNLENMYEAMVPGTDGTVEISLISYERNTSVWGRISDTEGNPASYVTVSVNQNVSGQMALSTLTDEDGFFNIAGLYDYAAMDVSVESNRYFSYNRHYSPDEVFGNVNFEADLKAKEIAFFLEFESEASEDKFAEAMQSLITSMNYRVTNGNGDYIGGKFAYVNGSTFCFIPVKQQSNDSVYSVTIDSDIVNELNTTVSYGETKSVSLSLNTKVSYVVTGGLNEGDTLRTFLFDEAGYLLSSDRQTFTGNNEVRYYLKPGSYTVAAFGDGDFVIVNNAKDIAAASLFYAEEIIITDGSNNIDLGNLYVPKAKQQDISLFNSELHVNTSSSINSVSDLISVSVHFDVFDNMKESSKLSGLSISNVGSNDVQTAFFAEGSLVINGVPTKCEYDILSGKITFDPVSFPCDISYKMRPSKEGNVILNMDAIVNINATEFEIPFLDKIIPGSALTVNFPTKTADGNILVKGTSKGTSVTIFNNGIALCNIPVNDNSGTYEGLISLPVNTDTAASFRLYAVDTNTGLRTDENTVLYTPNEAVTRGLYILCDGERQGQVYKWTPYVKFSFEADIVNAGELTGTPEFIVKLSDGSVEIFDSEVLNESRNITTYTTGNISFGNKLPVKVHLSLNSSEHSLQTISADTFEKSVNLSYVQEQKADNALVNRAAENSYNLVSEEGLIDKADMEDGEVYYYKVCTSNVSVNEIATYESVSNRHITGTDIYGNSAIDVYLASDNYSFTRAAYDNYEGKGYVEKLYILTTENYDEIMALIDVQKLGKVQNDDLIFLLEDNETAISIHEENDKEFGKTQETLLTPMVLDFFAEKLGDFGYKIPGGGNITNTFAFKACAEEILNYLLIRNEIDSQLAEVNALKKTAEALSEKGIDVTKLQNQIKNAESSYYIAMELATSEVIAALENNAISIAGGELEGPYSILVTGGTYIGGYMTGDMQVNIDIVKRGADGDLIDAEFTVLKTLGMTMDEYRVMIGNIQNGMTPEQAAEDIIKNIQEAEERLEREKQEAEEARRRAEELGTYEAEDQDEEFVDEYYKWLNESEDSSKNTEDDLDLTPIIDPSGYIYEAVASNRIENATVILYNDKGEMFDAKSYGQVNPLRSDSEGKYAWDVPEGNWLVTATASGYESNTSENDPAATVTIYGVNYLPVMPPQLDVNIGLTSLDKAEVSSEFENNRAVLSFSKYVKTNSFKEHLRISVAGIELSSSGFEVNALNAEISPAHTPYCGGEELATEFEILFTDGIDGKQVVISFDELYDYSNTLVNTKAIRNGETENTDAGLDSDTTSDNSSNTADRDTDNADEQEADKSSNIVWIIIGAGIALVLALGGFYYIKKRPKGDKN